MSYEVITGHDHAPIFAWIEGVPVEDAAMQQFRNVAALPFIYGPSSKATHRVMSRSIDPRACRARRRKGVIDGPRSAFSTETELTNGGFYLS